jgi:glycosyltransferase involved in cell wall biosynthesis
VYDEVILPFIDTPTVNLYIIGDGDVDYVNELKSKYRDYENIFFMGNVKNDQLKFYYSFMDYSLFIFSASISILETMACGVVPVYMSDLQFKGALKLGIRIDNISSLNAHLLERLVKIEGSRRLNLIHFIQRQFSYNRYIATLNKVYEN